MKYTIDEIVDMIESAEILIPIEDLFVEEPGHKMPRHVTKKEYGKVLLKHLVKELKEKY